MPCEDRRTQGERQEEGGGIRVMQLQVKEHQGSKGPPLETTEEARKNSS